MTRNTSPPQRPASTASKRTRWVLALTVLVGVGVAAFFGLRSLWGPQDALQKNEASSANTFRSTQSPAEPSTTSAPASAGAGPEEFTEEKLEQETMAVLKRLAQDFPSSADPPGLMGDVYAELGQTAEAMKCWEKCTELEPRRTDGYLRMAETAVDKGQFERAVAIAQRALKIDPAMPGIHSLLGRALRGLGRPKESLAAFEHAVKISPGSAENHYLLGQGYLQTQQFEASKQSFMAALQLRQNYTEACYGIVSACARLGQTEEAAKYRKQFQAMKTRDWQTLPDDRDYVLHQSLLVKSRHRTAKVRTNAGILYHERGQRQTAARHWLRAAELDPVNTVCREELMNLYQQDGRNQEALQVCEQLRKLAPENPQYHMCAGTLLTRLNRIEDALLAVEQAIKVEPNNASFRKIYQQIQQRR